MAIKPTECDGASQTHIDIVTDAEARADEELRARYRPTGGAEVVVNLGARFGEFEKRLFAERYAGDWNVRYSNNQMNGGTLAHFMAKAELRANALNSVPQKETKSGKK